MYRVLTTSTSEATHVAQKPAPKADSMRHDQLSFISRSRSTRVSLIRSYDTSSAAFFVAFCVVFGSAPVSITQLSHGSSGERGIHPENKNSAIPRQQLDRSAQNLARWRILSSEGYRTGS